MTPLEKFIEAMREKGIGPFNVDDIKADDQRRRYRVEGDKPGTLNGEYVFREDADGFAVGFARSYKTDETVSWHTRSNRKASEEEKQAWREKREAAKAAREAEDARIRERGRAESQRIWSESEWSESHPYSDRKQLGALRDVRTWLDVDRFETAIVIPARKGGEIVGLQKIYPDGGKLFVFGSDMNGSRFDIGDVGSASVVAVVEGWATGVTVNQATGWAVAVAYNAGNLAAVAKSVRAESTGQVVICSDEDIWTFKAGCKPDGVEDVDRDDPRWTEWREAGLTANRGRDDAMKAAGAIGGALVLYPEEGGDWNDVACRDGLDAVRDRLAGRVKQPEPEPETGYDDMIPDYGYEDEVGPEPEPSPESRINPLGYDRGQFFFFPVDTGQIMEFSATALAQPANLYSMADSDYWHTHYNVDGKMSSRQIADNAAADLMRKCRRKGIFNPENSRGVGVWRDGDKVVVNTGDTVFADGEHCKPQDYKGNAVYEAGPRVYDITAKPLRNKEASALRDICRRLSWRQPMMGDLLAGFLVLAPIGGALKWRPHVVITGEKGAGKSTVTDGIIKQVISDCGIFLDGGTTEAGLRKEIGLSSRPVVMDEAESETKKTREAMEGIFFLARKASSGSKSATAIGRVNVRSCFCVAAINPRIVQGPDKDRWSTLELVKDTHEGKEDRWQNLELDIRRLLTEEYSKGLLARTIKNIDTLLANIEVFRFAASRALGDARSGDQIGPLIAAAFSLTSDRKVDEEFAKNWIEKQDWRWRDADVDVPEHEKFLATVLTMRLRYDKDGMARESDIGALVSAAANNNSMIHNEAIEGLKQIGVKVEGDRLIFANNAPKLSSMLKDTVWSEWRRLLMKFEGSDNCDNKSIRFGKGINGKATGIPLHYALDEEYVTAAMDEEPF